MFNYLNNGITVVYYIDDRRAIVEGTYPIKIRLTYNRVRKYYSTGKNLSVEDWKKMPNAKSKSLINIRFDIQNSFNKVKTAVQELEMGNGFSFDALNSLLNKYEKYMLNLGRSYTTIGMYCRAIRCIINQARKAGIIKENQYPFGSGRYKIPTGQGRKLALTLQQIRAIVTYSNGTEATKRYRDMWFFSYLCNGINFADMLTLKYSNIRNGEICFLRAKTARTSKIKKEVCAIITPEIQTIIDCWGTKPQLSNNYIFPYLTGKETPLEEKTVIRNVTRLCNKRLKQIGKAVGIEGISTYTARHSYATVLKRSGANIAYISESLGHNDLKTTENYLASFEKEERIKNASFLTNFGE